MRYRYLGPAEIAARDAPPGRPLRSAADLWAWLADTDPRDRDEPFTYVVTADGVLRLAPRRSEHVACAGGEDVLAAGEITFGTDGDVTDITNQSTGYGPDPSCWPDAAAALDAAGITHPGGFTSAFTFRCCPGCGHVNLVKDDDHTCAVCDGSLIDPLTVTRTGGQDLLGSPRGD
ncbi:hypothetical protein Ait01nite_012940 [Actinoplanes italicus]|uniref:Uncharacterized protein n=1 Tax=Actinoplanes italicus TaxID=113567 RepID=A0A2T0KHL7_9ACTN|nr:hypothetical protein [Actinoplanes italicus]PRX22727.1 hypothetical protein CLV67_104255 [Actinoplanes italicus]GIE28249.1 hypothetical protein Ait01nite_012940 [Actinoplanes italicus]